MIVRIAAILATLCWQPGSVFAASRPTSCLTDPEMDPASKAVLSPVVFLARLESLAASPENANRFVAAFRLQKTFKSEGYPKNHLKKKESVTVTFYNSSYGFSSNSRHHGKTKPGPNKRDRRPTKSFDSSMTASTTCVVTVRDLRQNDRYLVYAIADPTQLGASRTSSLVAIGNPDSASSPSSRAVRKAVCQGCQKRPGVGGLRNVKVELKKKLKLQCRITGNPAPKVDWFKDDKKLKNNKRIKIRTKKKFSRLEIAIVRLQDAGEYKCRVTNVIGSNSISAEVRIVEATYVGSTEGTIFKGIPCNINQTQFCLNNGTCLFFDAVNEMACQCAEGFNGHRCESKDINTKDSTSRPVPKVEEYLFVTIIALVALITFTLFLVIVYAISRICRNYKKRRGKLLQPTKSSRVEVEDSSTSYFRTERYLSDEVDPLKRDNATEIFSGPLIHEYRSVSRQSNSFAMAHPPTFAQKRRRLDAVSSLSDVNRVETTSLTGGYDATNRSSWSSRRSRVTRSLISSSSLDAGVQEIAKTVVKAFQQYQQSSC